MCVHLLTTGVIGANLKQFANFALCTYICCKKVLIILQEFYWKISFLFWKISFWKIAFELLRILMSFQTSASVTELRVILSEETVLLERNGLAIFQKGFIAYYFIYIHLWEIFFFSFLQTWYTLVSLFLK